MNYQTNYQPIPLFKEIIDWLFSILITTFTIAILLSLAV